MSENGSGNGTLTIYQRMPDPIQAVKVMGNSIAKSGMFGCGSVEAGEVFALECLYRNMPPLTMAERYHVIFGKLSMKAEAMLAGFEQAGGKYKVLSRTPELAAVEFTIKDETHKLSLSWEDAQKEPFCYEGKEQAVVDLLVAGKKPPLKPKYATPRSRMQMLWARLVSDSVRFLCPQVVSGVYTPEEIEDFPENATESNGGGKARPSTSVVDQAAAVASVASAAAATTATTPVGQGEVIEADFVVVNDKPAADLITPEQHKRLSELTVILQCGEAINAACAKRAVGSTRSLKRADAAEIIAKLEAKKAALDAANSQNTDAAAGKSSDPGTGTAWACSGPCTQEQVDGIKLKLKEWAQIDPPGYAKALADMQAKLKASGKAKLADLSGNDAAKLYAAVQMKAMESFVRLSLESYQPKEAKEEPSKFAESLKDVRPAVLDGNGINVGGSSPASVASSPN